MDGLRHCTTCGGGSGLDGTAEQAPSEIAIRLSASGAFREVIDDSLIALVGRGSGIYLGLQRVTSGFLGLGVRVRYLGLITRIRRLETAVGDAIELVDGVSGGGARNRSGRQVRPEPT